MSTATARLSSGLFDRRRCVHDGDGDGDGGTGLLQVQGLADDVHPDVTDALLGFVYDPPADAGLDAFLRPLPRGEVVEAVQSAAARERRRRISGKTGQLSRLIPGAAKLNSTAEMLQAAARHVKLLQAQVGMLALMHSADEPKVPSIAEERMRALLASGGAQERLAGEGVCLVPTKLVHAIADDKAIRSNPAVERDLSFFMESLEQ
uniref:BHLH domain-containing protein n=1 Tax=Oryza brachyantha TaxID=4533 RepID=J3MJ44_ORYBR